MDRVLHRLKHDGPERVLRHLSRLARHYPQIQEHVNPMLALRLALLNERWSEAWQEQHRLRQRLEHLKRRTYQQQHFAVRQAKLLQMHPPAQPVASTPKSPRQKTGRTEAQYRWGRQTISSHMLKQANGAKK